MADHAGAHDVTRLALEYAVRARREAPDQLGDEPHDRPAFAETLAAFRDQGSFMVPELDDILGLSRSRTYALLLDANRRRGR
jgi:hypothetical protein